MRRTAKIKYTLWKYIYPIFVPFRNALLKVGFISHSGRQPFLLGKLLPQKTLHQLKNHLETLGFQNNFVAWDDDAQTLSMRKLIGSEHQYHLRAFKDGEIRGHYEFTPEADPLQHYYDNRVHPKTEDFLHFLEGWIIPDAKVMEAEKRIEEKEKLKEIHRQENLHK